jgi:hypothetical protein
MQIVDACTPEELEENETYYTVPLYTKPDTERQPLMDKQITEMTNEITETKQQALRNKYPKLFPYPCEISCDDGWFNILESICFLINERVTRSRNIRARDLQFNRALVRGIRGDTKGLLWYYAGNDPVQTWHTKEIDRALAEQRFITEKTACPKVTVLQVKEKFGGLRFYYAGGDDYVYGVVNMAECQSVVTCEVCGNHGKRRSGGWVKTLCDTHAKESDYDLNNVEIDV